ncbi:MAG: hypothetical protein ABEK36_01995, partial [Candidatus Aenigmatarchaeota archaeon]
MSKGAILIISGMIFLFYLIFTVSYANASNIHIAFHPSCGEDREVAYYIGKQLENELSGKVEEFKIRDEVKCRYKEDTNVPREFPFWTDGPQETHITISLERSDSNNIYFIKGDEYGREFALNLLKNLRRNGFDVGFRGIQCPGFINLCENYYGGSPISLKLDFIEGNTEEIISVIKNALVRKSNIGDSCYDDDSCRGSLKCNTRTMRFHQDKKICCPEKHRWNGENCVLVEETENCITFNDKGNGFETYEYEDQYKNYPDLITFTDVDVMLQTQKALLAGTKEHESEGWSTTVGALSFEQ